MLLSATISLFPAYSLDTSILAAVLVGVLLLAFFTETFGWVFVGLVVPGYLASIFLIHPEAGCTVAVEAVLTYLLAQALSTGLSRTGAWSQMFGRDRFFLIVLASVLVRSVSEAWVLPELARLLDAELGTSFTLDRTLHSIGLVLVPLAANAFWKLRLGRGLVQLGVTAGLTYVFLRWVLLANTNLSFGSLELTYEDVAQNFLASPKSYILLLVTAFLAARFNINYGWDFNGILVPALIALTWLHPTKLVATLAEVFVLVVATKALLALPGVRTLNLEGPRKTVLVFTLGFFLKWCLGWAIGGRVPGLKVTDLFGFGYLVPTLLAVKMLQKQVVGRIMLGTVHTSLAGVLVGSLVGFALSLLEPRQASAVVPPRTEAVAEGLGLGRTPLGLMAQARAAAREDAEGGLPLGRRRSELRRYHALWEAVGEWLERPDTRAEERVRERAVAVGLELRALPPPSSGAPQAWALSEPEGAWPRVGWDTALLVPGAPGPVLEVPRPVSEAPSAEAAAALCARVACRAIVVSGVDSQVRGRKEGDALVADDVPLPQAHAALEGQVRLLVRADSTLLPGHPLLHVGPAAPPPPEALWPGVEVAAGAPEGLGGMWEEEAALVLRAHPHDLLALVVQQAPAPGSPVGAGELRALLESPAPQPVPPARPTAVELSFLEHQVAAPLLARPGEGRGVALPTPLRQAWVGTMASLVGLQLRPLEAAADREGGWLVMDATRGRLDALLLLRTGGEPLALEAPGVERESGTLSLALEVWREGRARALLVAEPAPPGSAPQPHPATPGRPATAFHAFHQALHAALPPEGGLVLQVRGLSARPGLTDEVVLVPGQGVVGAGPLPAPVEALFAADGPLAWAAQGVRRFDGSAELMGLAGSGPQQAYANAFGGPPIATAWFSERLRGAFVRPRRDEELLERSGLSALPLVQQAPEALLLGKGLTAPGRPPSAALQRRFAALQATAERLLAQQDVQDAQLLARQGVRAYFSPAHGQAFLLLEAREGRRVLRAVYFLQQQRALLAPLHLVPGQQGQADALARALGWRAPVMVDGVVAGVVEGGR